MWSHAALMWCVGVVPLVLGHACGEAFGRSTMRLITGIDLHDVRVEGAVKQPARVAGRPQEYEQPPVTFNIVRGQ